MRDNRSSINGMWNYTLSEAKVARVRSGFLWSFQTIEEKIQTMSTCGRKKAFSRSGSLFRFTAPAAARAVSNPTALYAPAFARPLLALQDLKLSPLHLRVEETYKQRVDARCYLLGILLARALV